MHFWEVCGGDFSLPSPRIGTRSFLVFDWLPLKAREMSLLLFSSLDVEGHIRVIPEDVSEKVNATD